MLAVSFNVLEGGLKKFGLSEPMQGSGQCKRPEPERNALTQHLTGIYNFGEASPLCKNSLCLPSPCFLLIEQAIGYRVPVIPEAKTDAEVVGQLLPEQASLNVWNYLIM